MDASGRILSTSCLFLGVQVDRHDEAVQPEHLGEDEDEDHADEEPGLLGRAAHPGVAHDADGVARSEPGQAHGQAGAQVHEAPGGRVRLG